jgi:2-phospho-L-lactate guanylyltransferase
VERPWAASLERTWAIVPIRGLATAKTRLTAAIGAARSGACARGATAVLVLPADLPAVSAVAIDALVGAALAGTHGLVAIVTDRHGRGTNALLLSPPGIVDPAFGPDSRAVHRHAAAAASATYLELGGPLALDVDTPADLAVAQAVVGSLRD